MSEVFNGKRFWRYAKVRYAANRVFFITPLFIPALAILLIMSDFVFTGRTGVMEATFKGIIGFMSFFVFLILYSSRAFSEFHRRDRGFMLATLPASGFEKYLFSMLQVTVGFAILFAISFFASALIVSGYNHAIGANFVAPEYIRPFSLSTLSHGADGDFVYGNPVYFFNYMKLIMTIATIFAVGSIFFRRFGFLFSALIFLVYFWLTTNIAALFFGHTGSFAFGSATEVFFLPFTDGMNRWNHIGTANFIAGLSLLAVIAFLWIAAYRRLKEKEY
jgi:hypothetical protein